MTSKLLTTVALGTALLAGTLSAQPSSGDVVISAAFNTAANQGVFYVDWTGSPTAPLNTLVSGAQYNSVQTAYLNTNAVVCANFGPPAVTRVLGVGTTSTLSFGFPGQVHAMDLDQDANYVVAAGTGTSAGIYNMSSGGVVSTVTTIPASINGICRDNESGGYAWVSFSPAQLHRYDPRLGTDTTLRTTAAGPSGVCYMNDVNRYAVSTFGSNCMEIVTRTGGLVRSVATPGGVGQAVCYDDLRRRLICVTNTGWVLETTNSGTIVRSRQFPGYNFTGVDIWNDHSTNLNISGGRGTRVFINIRHPDSGGQLYCAAISLGNQGGFSIDTRHQSILPDALFFITVCGNLPLFTSGFSGTLSTAGSATATFTIPNNAPTGLMIYAVSSAVNNSFPSNLDLGVPEGVLVLP